MLQSHSPSYRFWLTVYAFPALLPLFLNVAYGLLVRDSLSKALGPDGPLVTTRISFALTLCFIACVLVACLVALYHSRTGKPSIAAAALEPGGAARL